MPTQRLPHTGDKTTALEKVLTRILKSTTLGRTGGATTQTHDRPASGQRDKTLKGMVGGENKEG